MDQTAPFPSTGCIASVLGKGAVWSTRLYFIYGRADRLAKSTSQKPSKYRADSSSTTFGSSSLSVYRQTYRQTDYCNPAVHAQRVNNVPLEIQVGGHIRVLGSKDTQEIELGRSHLRDNAQSNQDSEHRDVHLQQQCQEQSIYCTSHLEYCSPIWSPYQQKFIDAIEKVHKRAAWWVRGVRWENCTKYAEERNLFPSTTAQALV